MTKIGLDRRIPSHWSNQDRNNNITFTVECIFRDRRGLLKDVTEIIYNIGLSIKSVQAEELENGRVHDTFTLETEDDDYYIFERLEARMRFDIPELEKISLISIH